MLYSAVHLPDAYRLPNDSPLARRLYARQLTAALAALARCGILLLDGRDDAPQTGGKLAGECWREICAILSDWPDDDRKAAYVALGHLWNQSRLLELPVTPERTDTKRLCARALTLADRYRPELVLTPEGCACNGACVRIAKGVPVSALRPGVTPIPEGGFRVPKEGWSRREFENVIVRPLFATAKHVRIFDKQIGREFTEAAAGRGPASTFRETIKWLLGLYATHSTRRAGGVVEVYSVIDGRDLRDTDKASVAALVNAFETALRRSLGIPVDLRFKLSPRGAATHDRYLFTDQVRIQIGRGFDLLRRDGMIRETIITYAPDDAARVEREFSDLPSLR